MSYNADEEEDKSNQRHLSPHHHHLITSHFGIAMIEHKVNNLDLELNSFFAGIFREIS